MNGQNYECPYCGKRIGETEVLFWEKVQQQYIDDKRGDFLRKHGVKVSSGNMFDRLYYIAKPENIINKDDNGFPTMIRDHLGNAIKPEDLDKNNQTNQSDGFDDSFDSDEFTDDTERQESRNDRTVHNIPMRACPHCHCELPRKFGGPRTYHVAMFGGRAAGKTAYLVNLFQQIQQVSMNNLGSVVLEKESSDFLKPLIKAYEDFGTTTPTHADDGLLPIVSYYKNQGDEAYVTFYDIAGEGASNAAYMSNHEGIKNCETLILMIDPNMFAGGKFASEWDANHKKGEDRFGEGGDCCTEPMDSFLNNAGALCEKKKKKIKYIVCVITKLDMLLESESNSFSYGDIEIKKDIGESHRDAVDLATLKRIDENLSTYLTTKQKYSLREKIKGIFGEEIKITILGVSTSTLVKGADGTFQFAARSASVEKKHRIIEPFLVVLMRYGLIKAKKPDGKIVRYNNNTGNYDAISEAGTHTIIQTPEKKRKCWLLWWRKSK